MRPVRTLSWSTVINCLQPLSLIVVVVRGACRYGTHGLKKSWHGADEASELTAAAQALQAPGLQQSRKLSLSSYHRQLLASCLSGKAKLLLRRAAGSRQDTQLQQEASGLQQEAATLLGTK